MKDDTKDKYQVLSVEQAQERILAGIKPLGAESIPPTEALGRVLAEDVTAAEDIPPLANSAMDGYALRAQDTASASPTHPLRLRVIGSLAAGQVSAQALGAGEALRVMTGAPLPAGADAVVRFEQVSAGDGSISLTAPLEQAANVRSAGEDVQCGQRVLERGRFIRAQELGLMAGLGLTAVPVARRPLVAVIATGDELMQPGRFPAPGHIRDINGPTNAAQVRLAGGIPLELGIARDSTGELSIKIQEGLDKEAHLFVTSGGVSAGDFDFVKDVLSAVGRLDFWWVNMKPGRPLAFGYLGDVPLIALPGNPVAAFISFELFARPAILRLQGVNDYRMPVVRARLAEPITRKDGRRHYLRVRLDSSAEGYVASLTGDQGSGIVTSLVKADGLAVIPENCDHLERDSMVEVLLLR
ncbi:MAG: molybdopterin molybdotransferase MoeA [Chloroflexi bacterium]|nr:molybdopterin molybdotransferase MoeA [Chloroflexota bacterium]